MFRDFLRLVVRQAELGERRTGETFLFELIWVGEDLQAVCPDLNTYVCDWAKRLRVSSFPKISYYHHHLRALMGVLRRISLADYEQALKPRTFTELQARLERVYRDIEAIMQRCPYEALGIHGELESLMWDELGAG